MAYAKLSEQLEKLTNPQRSDAFVKRFRTAVREGEIEAMELPERFALPKDYKRRGEDDTYRKQARDMAFEVTPAFEKWFDEVNGELTASARGGRAKPKPTLENIEAGLVDFKALAEQTRQKMEASFAKGQALGKSRGQKSGGAAKTTRAKAPKRAAKK